MQGGREGGGREGLSMGVSGETNARLEARQHAGRMANTIVDVKP